MKAVTDPSEPERGAEPTHSLIPNSTSEDAVRAETARLASLGALAAGVAHEINNPLSYVLGSLAISLRELGHLQALLPKEAREARTLLNGALSALDNARDGAERVRHIVRDLMEFSRTRAASGENADVEVVLDTTLRVAWNEIRHRARLIKSYAGIPRVSGDETRLGQLFLNLIMNAVQSIEGDPATNEIRISTKSEGGYAVIEVSDSGTGIEPALMPRIFEPFFTTKPAGAGVGLGLAICHGIVTALGGEISVSLGVNHGSCFKVVLPFAPEDSAARRVASEAPPESVSEAGPLRILIIDDEPLLGQTLYYAFRGRHDVVVSTSGREALSRLERDARFDLVLCDLMMPDVSGAAVYEEVCLRYPELARRFVFMTGGAFTEKAREFLLKHPGIQLEKPFNLEDIEQLLRQFGSARVGVLASGG